MRSSSYKIQGPPLDAVDIVISETLVLDVTTVSDCNNVILSSFLCACAADVEGDSTTAATAASMRSAPDKDTSAACTGVRGSSGGGVGGDVGWDTISPPHTNQTTGTLLKPPS
jgi:hypothetical protein